MTLTLRQPRAGMTALALVLGLPAMAWAQSVPVYQSGVLGHAGALAKMTRNGQIQDASPNGLLGDAQGLGVNPFAISDALGLGVCSNSAATSGAYNAICIGHDASGNGLITLDSYGGLAGKALNARVNGTTTSLIPAVPPAPASQLQPINAATIGAVADGTTDNSGVLATIAADTSGHQYYFGPGVYRLACTAKMHALSSVGIIGAGAGNTILRYDTGCTWADHLFMWNGFSGVTLRDFTLDLHTPTAAGLLIGYINVLAYPAGQYSGDLGGSITGPYIRGVSVINGTSPAFEINLGAAGGYTITNPVIAENYVSLTASTGATQNQCIGTTTVNAAGRITHAQILNNTCVKSAIQFDGDNSVIAGNDISGWQFGSGIFFPPDTGTPALPSTRDNLVVGNIAHDAPNGVDLNNTATTGYENTCVNCTFLGNIAHDIGGPGFANFGDGAHYVGNRVRNAGGNGSGGAGGVGDEAGFAILAATGYQGTSQNVVLSANLVDGTTPYGMVVQDGGVGTPSVDASNHLAGVTQAINLTTSGVVLPGYPLYTKTVEALAASAVAVTFSGLDGASYRTWRLVCRDVTPATAGALPMLQVGYGGTPTFKTAANYSVLASETTGGGTTTTAANNKTGITFGSAGGWENTQATPGNFTVDFGDIAYPLGTKQFTYSAGYYNTTLSAGAIASGTGNWGGTGSTDPITAIRLLATTGNIYASCTLEGRP